MLGRLRIYADLFRYHRSRSAAFGEHDYNEVYLAPRGRLERVLGRPVTGLRLLDIGCGQRYPGTLLFGAAGNQVTGIDTELVDPKPGVRAYWRVARRDGIERAVKNAVRQTLFDPPYYARLDQLTGKQLGRHRVDVRQLSITEPLPFEPASFDAMISNAVFEHIPDVPAALGEVARLLRSGGVFHIAIHLFPSLSGGHHMRWAFPDTDPPHDIPPWDHLRENRFPAHVFLNELTEADYRQAFAETPALEVDEWITHRTEGEAFLTPEIEAELASRYTREDLLKRELIALGHRR